MTISARLALRISTAALALATAPLAATEPTWRLNLGLGLTGVLDADRHREVYGSTSGSLELGLEADFDTGWFLAATAARGAASGTDVLRVGEPTRSRSRFRPTTLDLTLGRVFASSARWRLLAGGGASALHWREENDLLVREDSGWGAHLAIGLRRAGEPWAWGATLRGVWIPDALEDRAGTTAAVALQDYRALVVSLAASRAIGRPGPARPQASTDLHGAARDFELRVTAGPVFATHTWRIAANPVARQTADHDPYPELGVGAELPLAGPLGVALDIGWGRARIESRIDYFDAGTRFLSSGSSDAWTGTVGLPVRLLERDAFDLRLVPLVAYLRYEVSTRGGFVLEGTDELWTAGLGLAGRLGRGPWGLHLALRHLALVRLRSSVAAFEFEPVSLQVGVSWRPGRGR